MPLSNSSLAYTDCEALFDAALEDKEGIRIDFKRPEAAQHLIARLHQFRKLVRKDNEAVHPPGSRLHGKSVYDPLVCRLRRGGDGLWWVYIEHIEIDIAGFQRLSEVSDHGLAPAAQVTATEMLALPAPAVGIKRRV